MEDISAEYEKFKTGLTFRDIRLMLAREQKKKRENFEYMFVTRRTVLGRFREIKLEMFKEFQP